MFDSYVSDDFLQKLKWISIGVGVGYVLKSIMPSRSKLIRENTLYLIDPESSGFYSSLFSEEKNNYKTLYQNLNDIPDDEDVNIIIQTYGGSVAWCLKICETIKNRRDKGGKVRVYIQDYAFSAGSVLALCADELYMTKNASLSAIDPQISPLSILSQVGLKNIPKLFHQSVDDSKISIKDGFEKEIEHYKTQLIGYINPRYDVDKIIDNMFVTCVNHEQLYFMRNLKEYKIDVNVWDGKLASLHPIHIDKKKETEIKTKVI